MTKITIPDTADLLARARRNMAEHRAEVEACGGQIISEGIIPDLLSTIEGLEKSNGHLRDNIRGLKRNMFRKTTRITALERALDEIIMEATSRNHAIDIARRARAEGGE